MIGDTTLWGMIVICATTLWGIIMIGAATLWRIMISTTTLWGNDSDRSFLFVGNDGEVYLYWR